MIGEKPLIKVMDVDFPKPNKIVQCPVCGTTTSLTRFKPADAAPAMRLRKCPNDECGILLKESW